MATKKKRAAATPAKVWQEHPIESGRLLPQYRNSTPYLTWKGSQVRSLSRPPKTDTYRCCCFRLVRDWQGSRYCNLGLS